MSPDSDHKAQREKTGCTDCGEAPPKGKKLRRVVLRVDGKKKLDKKLCRACTAFTLVCLEDPAS